MWIHTRQGRKRVDALLDDHPVVLEFDGAVKYRQPRSRGESERRVDGPDDNPLFVEKIREDAIRDEQFEVVRVVWAQLADPGGIGRRIDAAVVRAARRAS